MNIEQLIIYGVAAFLMSILSGIAGSGGGFIMTPLAIFLGLPPAQAVTSGKSNGLAITIGSLLSLRKYPRNMSKRRIVVIMLMSFIVGLIVPIIIKAFSSHTYQLAIGIMLFLILPFLYYRHTGETEHATTPLQRGLGMVLLPVNFLLEGVFSGGAGALTSIVLMSLFGQTAIEAQITRRWAQLTLNVTIIAGMLTSGLIIWPVALVGAAMSFLGSVIGGRLAIREGNRFAAHILFGLASLAAIALIFGAL